MKISSRFRRQRNCLALMPPKKRRDVIAFFQRGCISIEWFERKAPADRRGRRGLVAS
ncbi:hypothetical protein PQR33_36105 [Paraburkholderia sediminicola]|uniref:hypothetical protein n=1 Tax=Paraburkholderia sediminicola TaxID=458836 RepID=UPI0038B7F0AF